jgi:hypothetical protein
MSPSFQLLKPAKIFSVRKVLSNFNGHTTGWQQAPAILVIYPCYFEGFGKKISYFSGFDESAFADWFRPYDA